MRGPALPALLAALLALAAGCAGPAAETGSGNACVLPECEAQDYPGKPRGSDALDILGIVHDEALVPVAGAELVVEGLGLRTTADASGQFAFPPVEPAIYTVRAEAAGFVPATLTARPAGGSLEFILASAGPLRPYNQTFPFRGYLECAAEYAIVAGSCDAVLSAAGQPQVFQNQSAFQFAVDPAWATMVFDVHFDVGESPGLDGLRLTLRGADDAQDTGAYEQYGRFHDSGPFSFRVEPGGSYTDGTGPVPGNATVFTVDVYAQGHGYHEVCDPTSGRCFLGLGAATNVEFDVFVTVFYLEPAPTGFTLLR